MSLLDAGARRPEIPALTSLRFFAALWVVLFHVREINLWMGGIAPYRATIALGYLGVSFFFVLSGFILVYVYAGREIPRRRFFQARFARIYPAYLFSLLVTLPGLLYALPFLKKMHATALTVTSFPLLLEAWFPRILFFWNPVAWSLSVEVFFYLLFPFLLGPVQRLSPRALRVAAALSWIACIAITGAYVVLRPDGVAHTSSQDNQLVWLAVVKFNPLVRLPEFVLGMCTGALFLRRPTASAAPAAITTFTGNAAGTFVTAHATPEAAHFSPLLSFRGRAEEPASPPISLDHNTARTYSATNRRPDQQHPASSAPLWQVAAGVAAIVLAVALQTHIPYPVMHSGLLAPAFALIIFGFAAQPPTRNLVTRFLAIRPLMLLGEASYSLYLLHTMPIVILAYVFHLNTSAHIVSIVLLYLVGMSLLAIAVFLFIENPLRRLLRPRRRVAAATEAVSSLPVPAAR